jgi:hypothetical protein
MKIKCYDKTTLKAILAMHAGKRTAGVYVNTSQFSQLFIYQRSGYVLFVYMHSRAWLAGWVMYVVHSLCFNYIQLYIVDCWLYNANSV